MLSRELTTELEHQIRNLIRYPFELTDTFDGLHVDRGSDVKQAYGSMCVVTGGCPILPDDRIKPIDVLRQLFGRNSGVLDVRDSLCVSSLRHCESKARLPKLPDAGLSRRLDRTVDQSAQASLTKVGFHQIDSLG